jgi:hypothetical protein
MAGYVPFDPNKPLQPPAPADAAPAPAPAKPGGYVPYDPNAPAKTAGAPAPAQTTGGATGDQGWGVNWRTGDVTMPQSVQDFGNVAGNEATMGTLAGLRTEAQAARQRLGPAASAGADVAGNALSPTSLLMGLPGGAPIAGALHEGIKSYAAGNPWGTIADDAAMGGVSGFGGQLAAKAAPVVLPQLAKATVDLGPAAAMTAVAHKVFGDPSKDILGALGGYALMRNLSEGAGERAKELASSPAAQQAIKSLILGGSSAFRQGAGPWDQWIPGQ